MKFILNFIHLMICYLILGNMFWLTSSEKNINIPEITLNGGLSDSVIKCKELATISSKKNEIILVDLGCAIGDFVRLFSFYNTNPTLNVVAIGVDPLINVYASLFPHHVYSLYQNLFEAVICEMDGTIEINVNKIFLDLTSIKKIDLEVLQNLPSEYNIIKQEYSEENTYTISCIAMTMDRLCYLTNVTSIDLLKLDTQGNEYEILNNMSENLLENTGTIYVETSVPNKPCLYHKQADFFKIYRLLIDHNFEYVGAYGLDDTISLNDSIDINCIFINKAIFGSQK